MDKFLCLFVTAFSVYSASSLYTDGATRIHYGIPAVENQFPYMVSLQQLSQVHTTVNRGHKCGGALVTLQHAVTSAYCTLETISGNQGFHVINPAEYRVFAGSVLLTNDKSPARIRRIANITIHPEYNISIWDDTRFINDIAVITLGTPFAANTVARVPITNIVDEMMVCEFIGWGMGTWLYYERMWALNDTTCRTIYGPRILPSMMCGFSGGTNAASATLGDEGGPFVCEGRLLGILIERANSGPDVYTHVSHYSTWIDNVVRQPIPELGPEPPTQPPPTTTPSPGGASTIQPGMTVLAVIVAQIINVNVLNKSFIKTMGF